MASLAELQESKFTNAQKIAISKVSRDLTLIFNASNERLSFEAWIEKRGWAFLEERIRARGVLERWRTVLLALTISKFQRHYIDSTVRVLL